MPKSSISLAQIRTFKMQRILGMLSHGSCKRFCRFSPESTPRGYNCLSRAVISMNMQIEIFKDLAIFEI